MEIYFDRKTRKILRYIKWHPKNTMTELKEKFDADQLLINLCIAEYIVCTHPDGQHTNFTEESMFDIRADDNFRISPKGLLILEDRFDRIWQWAIPTLISVASLIISILSAMFPGVVKVLLLQSL